MAPLVEHKPKSGAASLETGKGERRMIVPFLDTDAGTTVSINPEYVVTLRPDPAEPERVSVVKLRGGERASGFKARTSRWRPSSSGRPRLRRAAL
jgi:hypothetical protein